MGQIASGEIGTYQRYIFSSLDRLVGCLSGLDASGLNWHPPAEDANTLYALAVHTLANAEENILGTLCRQQVARDREAEFAARGVSPRAVEERWREQREQLARALEDLPHARLQEAIKHPRRGTITGREVLLVVARHCAEHLGQAELTRDLLLAARAGAEQARPRAGGVSLGRGRQLPDEEVEEILALDVPARLATVDPDGYPRITPIWFLWDGEAFQMTSLEGRPHLANLRRDRRAAICVDTEDPHPVGGVRANRQVKAQCLAEISPDEGGLCTRRITRKYVPGTEGEAAAERRAGMPRVLITLRPEWLVRIGTARSTEG